MVNKAQTCADFLNEWLQVGKLWDWHRFRLLQGAFPWQLARPREMRCLVLPHVMCPGPRTINTQLWFTELDMFQSQCLYLSWSSEQFLGLKAPFPSNPQAMHFEAAQVRKRAPSGAKKVSRDTCLGHSGEGEGRELSVTVCLDHL